MTSINPRAENSSRKPLPKTDCRSVSHNRCRMHRAVNLALTFFRNAISGNGCDSLKAPRLCRVEQPSLRLRCGGARGLAAQHAGLVKRQFEEFVAVAKGDARLANRHAAVGFAFDAAIDGDDRI